MTERPTPRTDAAAFKQNDGTTRYSTTTGAPLKVVTADFARQLESELSEAREKLGEALRDLERVRRLREREKNE